ncbi:UDP-N-acetyl-D-glucosamine 6-dehydrogenase [compost metagenome]
MELLEAKGCVVAYSDPHVPVFPAMREHHFILSSEALTSENLSTFDAVILATDHDKFDYDLIKSSARLIVDSRGKYRTNAGHIIKA